MKKCQQRELVRVGSQTRAQIDDLRDNESLRGDDYAVRYGFVLALLVHVLDVIEQSDLTDPLARETIEQARLARRRAADRRSP